MGASGVYWDNVAHETILSQINGGAGVGPVSDAAASYRRIASTLREADQDLRDALVAAGASWEGQAAADMQTASTPLATWADEADQMAMQTSSSTDVFGDQFAGARSGVPAVVNVPSGSWVDGTGLSAIPGVTTDRERAEAAADAAQQEAARIMEAYDNASYETVQTQYFSQPPAVVLEVPPPSTSAGPAVGGTSTTAGGTPYSGAAYTAPSGYAAPGGAVSQPPPVGSVGGAVPGGSTAPAWSMPAPTVPGIGGGVPAGTVPVGGSPSTGGGSVLPPAGGGLRPGASGGRTGSGTGGSGSGHLPPVPGLPGAYRAGDYGPGGYRGGYGPGGYGGSAAGSGGIGSGAFGSGGEAHGQRGAASQFGTMGAEPDGRAGSAGRPGASAGGYGPVAGRGAQRDEDTEHKRPSYLVETEDVWGDGIRVAPPVIGERQTW